MKNSIRPAALIVLSLLVLSNCRRSGIEDYVARLPDLPQDIAATLDPKTMATKISTTYLPPEKELVAHAPCCGSTNTSYLKVNFTYTQCGPLRDFIVAPVGAFLLSADSGQRGGGQPAVPHFKVYKRRRVGIKTAFDQIVCMTSRGPWNATLVENRHCGDYTPQHTLTINAYGDVVSRTWNGGVENHPADVQLVSCRQIATTRISCGGLSGCQCPSSFCPTDQSCDCNLEGQW